MNAVQTDIKLKDIFLRPINRPIEGVIKADDEENLRNELEEYELIPEVAKRLEVFLDAYNNYTNANGVWLSGFFGCGKSHLLKMLSLVLENREVDGVKAADIFLPKCQKDSEVLYGDMKRAIDIPSKSILFNIDQKADVVSKDQADALLAVFVKVFDESCGYYGKQPYIAKFERDLDQEGLFEDFKQHFEQDAGRDWNWGRQRPTRIATHVDKAYQQVTGQSVSDVLDKYRADYKLSIEDFAEQINDYIKQQPPGFRLNFFVDEIGQYIARHVKLMTNLQTVAESLATKCKGQAWIIVTAQEEMDSILGDMVQSETDADSFSKIQARFRHRMKLTSADAAEVIQLRLLSKDETGIKLLSDVYHQEANNFNTLFSFTDGGQTYRNFKDKEHFVHCYPFIPYQFTLFQSAIQNLSKHNAFEGRHSSVGERSMLGVFQDVAIMVGGRSIGQLATFDLMFEGLRTALRSSIQTAIPRAEQNLGNPFAVRLLKALFMVKYVKEFKPSVRNICVLMLEHFDQDINQLHKDVQEGLALLESQNYVQRNGDIYEFLTDEEQDVEKEIKATEIDQRKIAEELEKLVFDSVLKHRKITYEGNKQPYSYTRKLDDKLHGKEHELAINVISSFHEHAGNTDLLRMQNMGKAEVVVIMPADDVLLRDLIIYQQTTKYIQQSGSRTPSETLSRILAEKGRHNQDRYVDIKKRVTLLLGRSDIIASGNDVEINSEEGQTRILKGFYALIERIYPNLAMLRDTVYKEEDIPTWLAQTDGLFGDGANLPETEREMLAAITSNKRGGLRTSVKNLLEKFGRKPYGWYYAAILCTLASLCARGKIEVRVDSNIVEGSDLAQALRNTHGHDNVLLEPQIEFTASQVRWLKEFYTEFFDTPPEASEAKALGMETEKTLDTLRQELEKLYAQRATYPFLHPLQTAIDQLENYKGKPYTWFMTELKQDEDALHDLKDDLIAPLRRFMAFNSAQKVIYDDARDYAQAQSDNFAYLPGTDAGLVDTVEKALFDKDIYKGSRVQQLKTQLETLKANVKTQMATEIDSALATLSDKQRQFCDQEEFGEITPEQQEQLTKSFDSTREAITNQTRIGLVRERIRTFEERDFVDLLSRLTAWTTPPKPVETTGNDYDGNHNDQGSDPDMVRDTPPAAPEIKIVPRNQIKVAFDKPMLTDENDVDRYLESMRAALIDEIKKGTRVQV